MYVVDGHVTYLNNRLLTLNTSCETLLLDVNHHILALQVVGHEDGDVDVANGLRPLVGESLLLGLLLGAGSGLLGGSELWYV